MKAISRRAMLAGTGAVGGTAVLGPAGTASATGTPHTAGPTTILTVKRGDVHYSGLTRGQNQRFVSNPDYVQLPRSTAEVVRVVQNTVDRQRRLTVRSGGHRYENFVDNPEVQVVLDMTQMKRVRFDHSRRAVMVESGATLGEAYYEIFKRWGVMLPGGSCYPGGIGGHVSGAGYGQMSRRDGLIIDHLYAVEVVVVDADGTARAVIATRESTDPNRSLWWAHTGGGGGTFGVTTRYWFRSPGLSGGS